MPNVNSNLIRKTPDGIYVPDHLIDQLMSGETHLKQDTSGLLLHSTSGWLWITDKLPKLKWEPQDKARLLIREFLARWGNHPICPKCENIMLRDKGWFEDQISTCPSCGKSLPMVKTVAEYISDGDYK